MRNVFEEYRKGQISWDEAYSTANNILASEELDVTTEETEHWASQMESLGVDAAEHLMKLLGYTQDSSGVYFKPGKE